MSLSGRVTKANNVLHLLGTCFGELDIILSSTLLALNDT